MKSVFVKVNDFTVEYRQSDIGNNVEVYVDGQLMEARQMTWFMRKLLDETLRIKKSVSQ